jgi:hypothetical protein
LDETEELGVRLDNPEGVNLILRHGGRVMWLKDPGPFVDPQTDILP